MFGLPFSKREKGLYFLNFVAILVVLILLGQSTFSGGGKVFDSAVVQAQEISEQGKSSKDVIFALGSYDSRTSQEQIEFMLQLHELLPDLDNVVIVTLDKSEEDRDANLFAWTVPSQTEEICLPDLCLPSKPFPYLPTLPGAGVSFKTESDTLNAWLPFIDANWGSDVTVWPIVMNTEWEDFSHTEDLINKVFELLPPGKTLVLGSTRLSRYQDDAIAHFHDRDTLQAIQQNYFVDNHIEAESPSILKLITNLANRSGQGDFLPVAYTSNQKKGETKRTANSTHLFGYFQPRGSENSEWEDTLGILSGYIFSSGITEQEKKDIALGKSRQLLGIWFGDGHFARGLEEVDAMKDNYGGRLMAFLNQYGSHDTLGGEYYHKVLYGFDAAGFNLETAVGHPDECDVWYGKGIIFRTEPHRLQIFKDAGFTMVNAANNHSHDCQAKGRKFTKKHLEEYDIEYFGHTRFGSNILARHYNGIKVAWFGFNDVDTPNDRPVLIEQMKHYTSDGYHVIVNIHWGTEYVGENNERQQELAHQLIDEAGVELIIGHHPHMVQNIEYYQGVPILYSLGNFVFDQPFPETLRGMAVMFAIGDKGVKIQPLYFNRNKNNFEAKWE